MYLKATKVEIQDDESGFELHVEGDFGPLEPLVINIQEVAEMLYDQARGRIGPYLRERDAARYALSSQVFRCDSDESGGYDLSDPKHPRYHSTHADLWDLRKGK